MMTFMSKFYVAATPIGNLKDISFRVLEVLKEADLILCEDTRTTKRLLERYKISKPCLSYHQHSRLNKINYILDQLNQGRNLILVSDAGTPGISDPGSRLIKQIVEKLGGQVQIIPLPGPSALTTALSISGFSVDKFIFLGFPPSKKKRNKFFEEAARSEFPVILFESPHRFLKTLRELHKAAGDRYINVGRELTKIYEEVFRGDLSQAISKYEKEGVRGEFVIILKS